ncbi:hypothetical protein ABTD77_19800, partial [Acinetobacter baumannii]
LFSYSSTDCEGWITDKSVRTAHLTLSRDLLDLRGSFHIRLSSWFLGDKMTAIGQKQTAPDQFSSLAQSI